MKRAKNNRKLLILLISLFLILVIMLSSFLFYQVNLQPVSSVSTSITFEIVEGDNIQSVVKRLEDKKIIKNAMVAKLYAKWNGLHNIKVGSFELDSSWSTKEILSYLNDANQSSQNSLLVTFREGLWAKEIAQELENRLGVSAKELLALWNDETYLRTLIAKYDFLSEDILNSNYRVKLEGYLFPETYHFAKNATKEEITEVFLDHFATIYAKYKNDIAATGMSVHQIVTFASMIQYEAKLEEDMYKIAGVFKNRLDKNMTLGSSVTICYALYDYDKPEECETNVGIDSPYNTYIHPGLPIGPILNPGEIALKAAIFPEKHDYLYFMADIYGDNTVYYAKTYEEHERNVNKYLR
ncbi:MAG: endolytic transglycosylase MltG [Erysipelotrichaceae bacterium]|nr:endolytic transglycosylase MltG [Erysipelotrichaceae bacterium]